MMSKATLLLTVLAACTLSVSGCAADDDTGVPVDATSVASTTTTPIGAPAPPSAPPAVDTSAPVSEPVTFECGDPTVYEYGTALYSDGSIGYEPSCDTPPPRELRYCDIGGVAVYTDGSSSSDDPACLQSAPAPAADESGYPYDPEQDRNGDGVVSGYERCGTACGEAPTSGEIQMRNGCEAGWIDEETCSRAGY